MYGRPLATLGLITLIAGVLAFVVFQWDVQRSEARLAQQSEEKLDLFARGLESELNRHRTEIGLLSRTFQARYFSQNSDDPELTDWLQRNLALTTGTTLGLALVTEGAIGPLKIKGAKVPGAVQKQVLGPAARHTLGRQWFTAGGEARYAFGAPIVANGAVVGVLFLAIDLLPVRDSWSLEPARLSVQDNLGNTVFSNFAWRVHAADPQDRIFTRQMHLFNWTLVLRNSFRVETWLIWQRTALAFLASALGLGLLAYFLAYRRGLIEALNQEHKQAEKLEHLVRDRTSQLEETQKELSKQEKLAAFGTTYPSISHEISQPIMALRSYSENGRKLLAKGRIVEAGENFDAIVNLTDRMNRIVSNLRAFARGQGTATREVDLEQTLATVISEISQNTSGNFGEILRITRRSDGPFLADAGDVRAHQVLLNLLQNAERAVRDTAVPAISVELSRSDTTITIDVIDNGPGVPAEITEDIFESFVTTRNKGGLGLGLSISRALVNLMGGTLELLPTGAEKGAHFQMTLKKWQR